MTNTQVTLVQLDNYGPWTVTPSPRREVDLQTLQSRLYADLSQAIGTRDGYVFFTRFDNMIAVTNGLDLEAHARVQESIRNRYPITASLSIGTGSTPADALVGATGALQQQGSAQDADRRETLLGQPIPDAERTDNDVQIAHFDVIDATGTYTDELDAFASFTHIEAGYAALMRHMHDAHDSLSFFVGGDNIIAVCPGLSDGDYEDAIAHVQDTADVALRVGVGRGASAHDAGMGAKHALQVAREHDTIVERSGRQ